MLMQQDRSVRLSKSLSYVLRHGADKVGVLIRPDGFIRVQDLLQHQIFRDVTLSEIIEIVENNDKKRFEVATITNDLFIRACQGHTITTLEDKYLLEPILDANLYPLIVHGTYERFLPSILERGLSKMRRNHIHMATSMDPASIVSGARKSAEVYIVINISKALAANIPFYVSKNGVVLSPGIGETGVIPSEYFDAIVPKADIDKFHIERRL